MGTDFGGRINEVLVHPTNPNRVMCGGVVANQSNNGGNSWSFKMIGHFDYHFAINQAIGYTTDCHDWKSQVYACYASIRTY